MDAFILKTLLYFQFFNYAPTLDETYTYLEKKISRNVLENNLEVLIGRKKIKKQYIDSTARYTLGEYSREFRIKNLELRIKNSRKKINNIKMYLRFLSLFSQIHLIGLSGSVAMMNAEKSDDIDLFIISSTHRVWTARFLAVLTARILSIGRKRGEKRGEYGGKVCLNLFFDGSDLSLPKKKRTLYGAHEVLQMKPLIDKQNTYNRFLMANKWVFKVFPNASSVISTPSVPLRVSSSKNLDNNLEFIIKNSEFNVESRIPNSKTILNSKFLTLNLAGDGLEWLLKSLQLILIRRHKTTELITDTQLWFHPEDFEKKMKKKVMLE